MAYCSGSAPIGAVVTDATGHIIARGRNRIYDAVGAGGYLHGHDLAHAEVNALVTVDYRGLDRQACALYTTTEPCPLCVGAFYMSGLRELHYASCEAWAGSVNMLGTTPYLQRKSIRLFGPEDPELEALIVALHVEFTYRRDWVRAPRAVGAGHLAGNLAPGCPPGRSALYLGRTAALGRRPPLGARRDESCRS